MTINDLIAFFLKYSFYSKLNKNNSIINNDSDFKFNYTLLLVKNNYFNEKILDFCVLNKNTIIALGTKFIYAYKVLEKDTCVKFPIKHKKLIIRVSKERFIILDSTQLEVYRLLPNKIVLETVIEGSFINCFSLSKRRIAYVTKRLYIGVISDIKQYKNIFKLYFSNEQGNVIKIHCNLLLNDKNTLVAAFSTIKVNLIFWDLNNYKSKYIIYYITQGNPKFISQISDNIILIGEKEIIEIDFVARQILRKIFFKETISNIFKFSSCILVNANNKIYELDMNKLQLNKVNNEINKYKPEKLLKVSDTKLITITSENSIYIWDLNNKV